MLTGLLCMFLGTAWAGGDPLRNDWSGEYDSPGNLTITVAPLRLAGQEFLGGGLMGGGMPGGGLMGGAPMLDMTVEFRTGGTKSFAITGATSLARATGMVEDLDIPGIEPGGEPGTGGVPGTGGEPGGTGGVAGTGDVATGGAQDTSQPGQARAPRRTPRDDGGFPARAPVEVGLQVRDYIVGSFDNGLFLGGHVSLTNPDFRHFRADRTTFGPMAGVKVTLSIFTVEARGGADVGVGKEGFNLMPRVDFATGLTF